MYRWVLLGMMAASGGGCGRECAEGNSVIDEYYGVQAGALAVLPGVRAVPRHPRPRCRIDVIVVDGGTAEAGPVDGAAD